MTRDNDDFIIDMNKEKSGEKKKVLGDAFKSVGSRIGSGFKKTGQFIVKAGKDYASNQELAKKNRLKNLGMQLAEERLKNKIRAARGNSGYSDDLINFRNTNVIDSGFGFPSQRPRPQQPMKKKPSNFDQRHPQFVVIKGKAYQVASSGMKKGKSKQRQTGNRNPFDSFRVI